MRTMLIPLGVGLALFASCGLAVGQGHGHGGGGGTHRSGGGGAIHGRGGSGIHGPVSHAYRTERARYSYRAERTRQAESRRVARSQRAQGERHEGRDVHSAMGGNERTAQERRETERLEQRVAQRHTEIQNARMELSADNKERPHHAFDMNRARVHNVNFDYHVGRRIPRHIHLFHIPAAVFAVFPYYEDYSYSSWTTTSALLICGHTK
jgi:hypothetical protein